jgi:hypothetical protein
MEAIAVTRRLLSIEGRPHMSEEQPFILTAVTGLGIGLQLFYLEVMSPPAVCEAVGASNQSGRARIFDETFR